MVSFVHVNEGHKPHDAALDIHKATAPFNFVFQCSHSFLVTLLVLLFKYLHLVGVHKGGQHGPILPSLGSLSLHQSCEFELRHRQQFREAEMALIKMRLDSRHGLEESGFQRLGEPGVHSLCPLQFAFKRLKVVKAALSCDLAPL